jgi:hypothetical protein
MTNNNISSAIKHLENEIKKIAVKEKEASDRFYKSVTEDLPWGNGILAECLDDIQADRRRLEKIVQELNRVSIFA